MWASLCFTALVYILIAVCFIITNNSSSNGSNGSIIAAFDLLLL